jgi:hypothetical protein
MDGWMNLSVGYADKLIEAGIDRDFLMAAFLRMTAKEMGYPNDVKVGEHCVCKVLRKHSARDLFFQGQSLYNIVWNDDMSDIVVLRKVWGSLEWENFIPPTYISSE